MNDAKEPSYDPEGFDTRNDDDKKKGSPLAGCLYGAVLIGIVIYGLYILATT